MAKLFIDPHCHFFSARHVPLTHTLQRLQAKMVGSDGKKAFLSLKAAAIIPLLLPVLPFIGKIADKKLDGLARYIQFFDTDAAFSIQQTIDSLQAVGGIDIETRTSIFTPLLMDFEKCVPYKSLADQVSDIRENIDKSQEYLAGKNCKFFPILGLDLRRFHDCSQNPESDVAARLDMILKNLGITINTETNRNNLVDIPNGTFIGIKLYPSLGCDLWPADDKIKKIHLAFFQTVAERNYPVTVHCQTDSYECGDPNMKDKELVNYGHPSKWAALLENLGTKTTDTLRLNLAHFGGESDVADLFDWPDGKTNTYGQRQWAVIPENGIRKGKSWTYPIMALLKKYPRVYSDLGAFDFTDSKAASSLLWLLSRDEKGEFDTEGAYTLRDKLLWGSDVPMTLYEVESYADQFNKFFKATNPKTRSGDFGKPPFAETGFANHAEFIETLIDANPAKFLFGE